MKLSPTRTLSVVTLAGFLFFLGLFFHFTLKSQIKKNSVLLAANNVTFSEQEKVKPSLPVRLKIPSINVNANIEYVGLTSEGRVGVPKGPLEVAWYKLGPRPGEPGSSIIDGHSGWKNDIPAVFDNLYKLKKGDKIYIEDEKGGTITFVVREIRSFNPNLGAGDVFGSSDGKAHLNLITCTGVWNAIAKTHSKRLVVFTDKEIK